MKLSEPRQTPPPSFWAVALIGLAWNLFWGVDYWMTRSRNIDYLKQSGDPQVILDWIDSFPLWAQFCWGLGVWGSVAGSVLLILRSRHAIAAFLISLVGAVGSLGYQTLFSDIPASLDTAAGKLVAVAIPLIVIFQWQFSRRAAANGVLR